MKKLLKKVLLCAGLLLSSSVVEATKANLVLIVKNARNAIKKVKGRDWETVWFKTYNPRQRDQLYMPLENDMMKYRAYNASLFFMRAADLDMQLSDMIDLDVFPAPLAKYMNAGVDDPDTGAKYTLERATQISNDFIDQVRKMTFQEHRLGAFLEKEWEGKHWYGAIQTWAGMAERNFWLDESERQKIADLAKMVLPDSDGTFNYKDCLSMRWGLGDTRLRLGYGGNCFTPHAKIRVGVQTTLPTARSVYRPTSGKQMPTGLSAFAKEFLMDRLREVLIEAQLGSGHYSLGAFSRLLVEIPNTNLSLKLHGQADYAFETGEQRYLTLVRQKNAAGTADLNINASTSSDKDVRRFINQFFVPKQVSVTVAPGITAQAGATLQWRRNKWSVYGGYDFFYKDKEQLSRFNVAGEEDAYMAPYESMSGRKEQHRLLGGITYDSSFKKANLLVHVFDDLDLTFRLHGSGAVHSEGMADDFSISLSFGGRF